MFYGLRYFPFWAVNSANCLLSPRTDVIQKIIIIASIVPSVLTKSDNFIPLPAISNNVDCMNAPPDFPVRSANISTAACPFTFSSEASGIYAICFVESNSTYFDPLVRLFWIDPTSTAMNNIEHPMIWISVPKLFLYIIRP